MTDWEPDEDEVRESVEQVLGSDLASSPGFHTSNAFELGLDDHNESYFLKVRAVYGDSNRKGLSIEEMENTVHENLDRIRTVDSGLDPMPTSVIKGENYLAICQPVGEVPSREHGKKIAEYVVSALEEGYYPDISIDNFREWEGEVWQTDVNDPGSVPRKPDIYLDKLVEMLDSRSRYFLQDVLKLSGDVEEAVVEKVVHYEIKAAQYMPEEFGLSDSHESV